MSAVGVRQVIVLMNRGGSRYVCVMYFISCLTQEGTFQYMNILKKKKKKQHLLSSFLLKIAGRL